ncbi:PTS sugar transporter subunit IIA [Agilicoccus flavus]|uniref:PTS sugar transporter subunit IIA n=1 Tax=Agilicoccus flavus TaxID=2775968 RepID=UPI001CF6DA29|nr:PTS sugar transporter subunit IIA [Agilicoccus flavus]
MPLTIPAFVHLDLAAGDRVQATQILAQSLLDDDRLSDLDAFLADVRDREEKMLTALPGAVAIPHSRSAHVRKAGLAFGRSADGIDWGGPDGPTRLVFLIAVPDSGHTDHLAVLAKLARRLTRPSFRQALLTLDDPAAVSDLLTEQLGA